eukprot:2624011-Amphidinium_carterae.1
MQRKHLGLESESETHDFACSSDAASNDANQKCSHTVKPVTELLFASFISLLSKSCCTYTGKVTVALDFAAGTSYLRPIPRTEHLATPAQVQQRHDSCSEHSETSKCVEALEVIVSGWIPDRLSVYPL